MGAGRGGGELGGEREGWGAGDEEEPGALGGEGEGYGRADGTAGAGEEDAVRGEGFEGGGGGGHGECWR